MAGNQSEWRFWLTDCQPAASVARQFEGDQAGGIRLAREGYYLPILVEGRAMSHHPPIAGKTLVIEFANDENRQTLMVPIDAEGNAITHSAQRMDGQPLGKTQINDEILVDGRPQRVVAVYITFRMALAADWDE